MEIPPQYAANIVRAERRNKRTILLKGASGTGKTFQFRTMAQAGLKGLYADVEAKLPTIEDLDPEIFLLRAVDIPLTPADKKRMLTGGESDFIKLCDFLRSPDHDYDFVYFDSLMRFSDELVAYLKYQRGLSGFELWGVFGEKMRMALKTLVSLASIDHPRPVHVIATWGVEVGSNWEGKRAIQPIVDGKMVGPRIDYYFDDVLMLTKREDAVTGQQEFLAYTGGTGEFSAKVSSAGKQCPPVITDPNLARIINFLSQPTSK